MTSFNDFLISNDTKNSLARLKFVTPTPIQEKAIPKALLGEDFIATAQTGTGKTLAFAIPVIEKIRKHGKMTIVLCPTRELAMQIETVFKQLLNFDTNTTRIALIIGGASMSNQMRNLKAKPKIIIATPGRLVDHLSHKTITLESVDTLILDEADRMLDMGFAPQIDRIVQKMPRDRQTILFSATFPTDTERLARKIMKSTQKIAVGQLSAPTTLVKQITVETTQQSKNNLLLDVLNERDGSILIFARTKRRTDRLYSHLMDYGYSVCKIHGDRSQSQRNAAIKGFKERQFKILVATDVAARGIDISNVAHIVNYDLPQTGEDYVHRIGRSGRAGVEGCAISFLVPEEKLLWKSISRFAKIENQKGSHPR